MKITVAGAGAGKTTKMADYIRQCNAAPGKIVFCIAFTNAAVDNIRKKMGGDKKDIPTNISICTIHSFLYEEFIDPYNYLLYGKHYKGISVINLPAEVAFKNKKIRELEDEDLLHISLIPERAKWIVYKKSKDTAKIKSKRQEVLNRFLRYCCKIYVDESQDIDKHIMAIFIALEKAGVDIELFGDPKQDVKGYGCYRDLINSSNDVTYISECHRCPQKHLQLSNLFAEKEEKQAADANNCIGTISLYFESKIDDLRQFIDDGDYGLCYISQKNEQFNTHSSDDHKFESLFHHVYLRIAEKWHTEKSDLEIKRAAYYVTRQMLISVGNGETPQKIINAWIEGKAFDRLSRVYYAQIASLLTAADDNMMGKPVVNSIESIKGLEDKNCLFILTTDLAPYFFGDKTDDNKTKHLLYVALTRSLDKLTMLVTAKVEERYSAEKFCSYIQNVLNT